MRKEPAIGKQTNVRMPPKVVKSTDKVIQMEKSLPGFVKCTTLPPHGDQEVRTTLIMQRYLLTMIETNINRDEAVSLAKALVSHFGISVEDLHNDQQEDEL